MYENAHRLPAKLRHKTDCDVRDMKGFDAFHPKWRMFYHVRARRLIKHWFSNEIITRNLSEQNRISFVAIQSVLLRPISASKWVIEKWTFYISRFEAPHPVSNIKFFESYSSCFVLLLFSEDSAIPSSPSSSFIVSREKLNTTTPWKANYHLVKKCVFSTCLNNFVRIILQIKNENCVLTHHAARNNQFIRKQNNNSETILSL